MSHRTKGGLEHLDATQNPRPNHQKKCPTEIVLRLPGRWNGPGELARKLPTDFRLERGLLILPDGFEVEFTALAADGEFPQVFESVCRGHLDAGARRQLQRYTINACLTAEGGSLDAARRMLEAGAALLRAGAIGVFVESALGAHNREDWLDMADVQYLEDVLSAFVNLGANEAEVYSIGMRVLGHRDCVMTRSTPRMLDCTPVFRFLHDVCAEDLCPGDHKFYHYEQSVFRICNDQQPYFPEESTAHNPFGRWRLVPVAPKEVRS